MKREIAREQKLCRMLTEELERMRSPETNPEGYKIWRRKSDATAIKRIAHNACGL